MARIHGRNGRVYIAIASGGTAEPLPFVARWSIEMNTDQAEATVLGDANKTYLAGLPDAKGTFSGFLDDATYQTMTAARDGVARKFYLYPSTPGTTEPYWFGTVNAGYSAEGAVDDNVKMSADWSAASDIIPANFA